VETQRIVRII